MVKPKYFLQSYPFYIFGLALILLAIIWMRSDSLSSNYMDMIKQDMEVRTNLLRLELAPKIGKISNSKLEQDCKKLSDSINTRITIIRRDGLVLADSEKDPDLMSNHADRPEIKEAFAGKTGVNPRFSATLNQWMLYVALPVRSSGEQPEYVIRASRSISSITQVLTMARRDIIMGGIIAALVTALISLFMIRKVGIPIEDIRKSAQMIAAGNLDTRIPVPAKGEIKDLAQAINGMAEQLKSRLQEQIRQKNERNGILGSMVEGVIAVDNSQSIIWMNDVAQRLLSIEEPADGAHIYEVQRHSKLVEFAEQIIEKQEVSQQEIIVTEHGSELFLKLKGSVLRGSDNEAIGALIVIADITEIKKLENFRRDFIANVSHEIRTPLTAIRGAVETLQEARNSDPAITDKLMDMITRHCDRLNALGEDILCLSSLERDALREDFKYESANISDIVSTAVGLCKHKASQKDISINIIKDCDEMIDCDRQLLEQALINLVDNAVKYSENNSTVDLSVEAIVNERMKVSVRDFGAGIPAKHLSRLFERFYRVDKARSRKLGGTGLGLAIVKHIVQVHHGSVDVQSNVGEGSIFTIIIPIKQKNGRPVA